MSNRQTYPASLFPNRGDIEAEAGAVSTVVIGIQDIPVSPIAPIQGQSLIAISTASGINWIPESAGDWVSVNGVPVSDDYFFGVNIARGNTNSPGVFVNGV